MSLLHAFLLVGGIFAGSAYIVLFIDTLLAENRFRLLLERESGSIAWGESLFVTALKLGLRYKSGIILNFKE